MRRCHLRGQENILKRQLVHVGAFNLSLILRKLLGAGTPRELRNLAGQLFSQLSRFLLGLGKAVSRIPLQFAEKPCWAVVFATLALSAGSGEGRFADPAALSRRWPADGTIVPLPHT